MRVSNLTVGNRYVLVEKEYGGMPFYELKNDLEILKPYLKEFFKTEEEYQLQSYFQSRFTGLKSILQRQ